MTDADILRALPGISALVAGDICLDRWCKYDPEFALPSAETGIPRLAVVQTETTAGAGGTVANNLKALGVGRVAVLGAIGDDGHGYELRRALRARGIEDELLVELPGAQTFTYSKLVNRVSGREDRPRVDFLFPALPTVPEILDRLQQAMDVFDVILVADQAETDHAGVVSDAFRKLLAELASVYPDRVIVADSRRRAGLFRRVYLKLNEAEAQAAAGLQNLSGLWIRTRSPALFVTLGGEGVRVLHRHGETEVRTVNNPAPVDICGAGDSFAAGLGVALHLTGSPVRAAQFANRVAQVTITKPGTGTASPAEVLALP